ncbi:MAG: PilX N-terminal domain-containing pilus assembly protein [Pseudomonadota bacterium]
MRQTAIVRQQGAALLVCLIILVLVTLIGLTTMKSSMLQEKMSGGNSDKTLAFEAAEMTLRDVEQHIRVSITSVSGFAAGCEAGLCLSPIDGTSVADSVDWESDRVALFGAGSHADALSGLARQPKYIIELLSEMQPPQGESIKAYATGTGYRITALAYGRQDTTRVMLQSTFYKP